MAGLVQVWGPGACAPADLASCSGARVELLYFPDCPHVERRVRSSQRPRGRGLPSTWTEHDVCDYRAGRFRGYGSPTILVDGLDVMGAPRGDGQACRLYVGTELPGAPPLRALVHALTTKS